MMRPIGVAIFFVASVQSAHADACLKFSPAAVTLLGSVMPTVFYGPPNFGEDPKHDSKGKYPVLKLEHPARICAGQTDKYSGPVPNSVSEIQMIFYHPPYGANWNGKRVMVKGKLYPWDNANQHTPVLIGVDKIQAVGKNSQ